jgi:hypothetical protein
MIRGELLYQKASCMARRAALASPWLASMWGRRLEQAAEMSPLWSLRMRVAIAKCGLIATSQFTLREPLGGGSSTSWCQ